MPEDDMLLKDVGTRYLHELTSRSFFQQVHQRRKCYLIHDLMHDLALSVSAHEVLMLQNDKNEQRTSPSIVRHLAICASNLELSTLNDLGRYDRLRSILRESFPQFGNSGYYKLFCLLRLKPGLVSSDISATRHKPFLFSEVPETELTALQVLPAFEITELKDLTQLQRTLCITHLENVESQEEARQAKLCDKEYLDKLKYKFSTHDFSLHEEVLEGLQPHPNLKKLDIVSYCGEKYPSWLQIQVLPLLSSLQIKYCPDIKDVFRLPHSLKSLVLADVECLPGNVFRNLTALKLLKIENCPKLRSLGGSEALTSLKIVNISDCPGLMESEPLMSVEKVRKEDTSALKLVIDNTALLRLSFFKTLLASTMSLEILGSPETLMFVGGDDEW
ncbi:putative disease resistance protein RGA4, partial [Ananas comosus]